MLDKYSSNPGFDKLRIFELALFTFLTGNADMHLKNFSLIYSDMIDLAPAYDLLSTRLVISEKNDPEESALTLNGKRRKLKLDDFMQFGFASGLNEKQIANVFQQFRSKIQVAMNFINKSFLEKELRQNYKQLLENRAKRLNIL